MTVLEFIPEVEPNLEPIGVVDCRNVVETAQERRITIKADRQSGRVEKQCLLHLLPCLQIRSPAPYKTAVMQLNSYMHFNLLNNGPLQYPAQHASTLFTLLLPIRSERKRTSRHS